MSLKDVLEAQQSGELDLLPGSAFNEKSPLIIAEGGACVMMDGHDWYYDDVNLDRILEALELLGYKPSDVVLSETEVKKADTKEVLFTGEDIDRLLGEIVSEAGIEVRYDWY